MTAIISWILEHWQAAAVIGGAVAVAFGWGVAWLRGRAGAKDELAQAGLQRALEAERAADRSEDATRREMAACAGLADAHARVMCKVAVAEAAAGAGRASER